MGVMVERTSDHICPINLCYIIFLDWRLGATIAAAVG